MKTCFRCKIEKALSEFYVQRSRNAPHAYCKACSKASVIAHNEANPQLLAARQLRYREWHRKQIAEKTARWYLKNKKRNNEMTAAWYHKNLDRGAAKKAKYYAGQRQAIPKWANQFFISEAYSLARLRTKMFGFKWCVDHSVPLKSKIVCGLHWEGNMQVIPLSSNSVKGNRVWPDMP